MTMQKFVFESCSMDYSTWTAELTYRVTDGPVFTERFIFEPPKNPLTKTRKQAIDSALKLLHLAAGVSYYKAYFGMPVVLTAYDLCPMEKDFFDNFYAQGLSEFIYRNDLDFAKAPVFPLGENAHQGVRLELEQNKTLVPIGGGKDSAVSLEALKDKFPVLGISVGSHGAILETARSAHVNLRGITRKISTGLFEINKAGALNGHVPVTGIISFAFVIEAVLSEFANIVMSNERSANVGNFVKGDTYSINHQWSKSFECERGISDLISNQVSPDINYFSILRPFSELDISRIFATSSQHFHSFTSCNRVFKINEQKSTSWCCECEKCRFVFLCLACFIDLETLVDIFGKNILDDAGAIDDYKAMLGLDSARKPFECVGETDEVAVAFSRCFEQYENRGFAVLTALKEPFEHNFANLVEQFENDVFSPIAEHNIPQAFLNRIMGYFGYAG